ncbi:MAG: helix-turn-helix domain-containing protein [Deltaproteobacteria bacterium]|nr:helix-turn-helix domain-containing protein [Deltaproteobacteria bacterium]
MEPLKSVKQAAEQLGISPHTIRAWVAQRRIPHVRLSRRVLFRERDLANFVNKNLVEEREWV